VTNFEILGSR